jgi:CheY-like chemotaxis protein
VATVLVVDDDDQVRRLLCDWVARERHAVVGAACGRDALEHARLALALAILDLRLPDTDGIALFAEIRRVRPTVRGIVISGYGTLPAASEAARQGIALFLPKPLRFVVFQEAVRRVLAPPAVISPDAGPCDRGRPAIDFEAPAAQRVARAMLVVAAQPHDVTSLDAWGHLIRASRGSLRGWCAASGVHSGDALALGRALRVYRLVRTTAAAPEDLLDFADARTRDRFLIRAGLLSGEAARRLTPAEFCARQMLLVHPAVLREVIRLTDFS